VREFVPIFATLVVSCGHAAGVDPAVLARTDTTEETDAGVENDIDGRIFSDEQRAAEQIAEMVVSDDGALSGWAAVYTLRLGLKHDTLAIDDALRRGVATDEPLLEAVSWRWLATREPGDLPGWRDGRETDPVVNCFAALALARKGKLQKALASALGLPAGAPFGEDRGTEVRERVERLLGLTTAVDDGPLALAVAFQEARRGEWAEQGPGGGKRWVAERLREELLELVLGEDPADRQRVDRSREVRRAGFTALSRSLESALHTRPPEMLRAAALTGEPPLRVEALRALAVVVAEPTAGDFGTAAAALDADDPMVRLEGARTFLMFAIRARKAVE